jgi:hypothetical protein
VVYFYRKAWIGKVVNVFDGDSIKYDMLRADLPKIKFIC